MSDTGELTLSPEEIAELRAERNALMAERDAERAAREAEARRADGLYNRVADNSRQLASAQISSLDAQLAQADGAITGITSEMAGLKSQYSAFLAEGKFDEAAEVQEKISDAAARRNQAQQAKTYFAQQRETAAKQPVDPVDQFLSKNNFAPAEQDWIKRNPRFATDTEFQARVTRAHNELVAKGVVAQSPEYFQGLEQAGYMRVPPAPKPEPRPAAAANGGAASAAEGGDPDNPYSEAADDVIVEEPVQTPPARPAARTGVAAGPSHRAPATPRPQAGQKTLTRDEAETALALSEYMPEEVQAEGEAGIYAFYQKMKDSPTARRIKSDWSSGG